MAANGIPSALTIGSDGSNRCTTDNKHAESKNEGTIELTFYNVRSNNNRISASTLDHKFGNLKWFLSANNEKDWNKSLPYLDIYLRFETDPESSLWYVEVDVTFKLRSYREDVGPFIRQYSTTINFYSKEIRFPRVIEVDKLLLKSSPYVKRNEATLEAHIVLKKSIIAPKYYHCSLVDFTQPGGQSADGVLVVAGVRLYVSKAYLSIYSPVFAAMFHGEFRERQMDEVQLKDVKSEEFIELLHVIYPSQKPVNANNVVFLLKLGDQFQMRRVMNACETYLVNAKDVTMSTKLALGEKYHLCALQLACVNSLVTARDVVSITRSLEYIDIGAPTRLALLERVTEMEADR